MTQDPTTDTLLPGDASYENVGGVVPDLGLPVASLLDLNRGVGVVVVDTRQSSSPARRLLSSVKRKGRRVGGRKPDR